MIFKAVSKKAASAMAAASVISVGVAGPAIASDAEKILSCNQLVDTYAVNVDRRDGAAVGALFVEGAKFYVGDPALNGPEEIAARFSVPNPAFKTIVHHMSSRVVENVTETGATGRVHAVFAGIPAKPADESGEDKVVQIFGVYDDVYVFVDGQCKFSERKYTIKLIGAMDSFKAN